jgi:hypothetical protein
MMKYRRITIFTVIALALAYIIPLASAQQELTIDEVMVNGDFEQGFQSEFGIGYGWGGFSNGDAVVGWNADTWDEVVVAGQYSQLIQIENATKTDRFAGVYQTVQVVPGEQYKLTINGLIRSQEGNVKTSNYGYGLQYGVDYHGETAWEKLDKWQDIAWNEQPLYQTGDSSTYRFETFGTTITAKSDTLTLFIRGWKKWIDESEVVFNLDQISLVGPVPGTEIMKMAQTSDSSESDVAADIQVTHQDNLLVATESSESDPVDSTETPLAETVETEAESEPAEIVESDVETEPAKTEDSASQTVPVVDETTVAAVPAQLPVSGQHENSSLIYLMGFGVALLLLLFISAGITMRQRHRWSR